MQVKTCLRSIFFLVTCAFAACAAGTAVKPPSPGVRVEQNRDMLDKVLALGQNGDWLAIRGYHGADRLVTSVTNIPISHVAVLDHDQRQVVEAERQGVHLSGLEQFIDKAHRVILIRPFWAENEGAGEAALAIARGLVGQPYDFLGTVGVDNPHAYYCSELAVHIYRKWIRESDQIPRVIEPGQMYLWGTILYDSRPRPPG